MSSGICAVINHFDAARLVFFALYSMQHRGQFSAGIVSRDPEGFHRQDGIGYVAELFHEEQLPGLGGDIAIGSVRNLGLGEESDQQNVEPLVVDTRWGPLAMTFDGGFLDWQQIRDQLLQKDKIVFQTQNPLELVTHLVTRSKEESLLVALQDVFGRLLAASAYSLVILSREAVYILRDPSGFRPLWWGRLDDAYIVASETCAFDQVDAEVLGEVRRGTILQISGDQEQTFSMPRVISPSHCVYELVYFANPQSQVFAMSRWPTVYQARVALGRQLAIEAPVVADVVVPVPDSGVLAAHGFSRQSGISYGTGLIRNHYIGRIRSLPQTQRLIGRLCPEVKLKLNAIRETVAGKRVVVVDDSVYTGETIPTVVKMLRQAGACEVHVRISSPPVVAHCPYGMDSPAKQDLIAMDHSLAEMERQFGADSLKFLSDQGLHLALAGTGELKEPILCTACFDGYPLPPRFGVAEFTA